MYVAAKSTVIVACAAAVGLGLLWCCRCTMWELTERGKGGWIVELRAMKDLRLLM